jgi:hypothetical protein
MPKGMTTITATVCSHLLNLPLAPFRLAEPLSQYCSPTFNYPANTPGDEREAYQAVCELLGGLRRDFVVKDVSQPYLTSRYVLEHPGSFRTLYIQRPEEEVIAATLQANWPLPQYELLHQCWSRIAQATIQSDDILHNPPGVRRALRELGYTLA